MTEEGSFDGLAYGYHRVWMDCGSSNACGDISVFNRITGEFEAPLDTPNRFGNGSGGAAFLQSLAVSPPPCIGDIDGDGLTGLPDYTILAGNIGLTVPPFTGGDLNGDGVVGVPDLNLLGQDFGCR